MPAILIGRGIFHREIDQSQFFIDGDLSPYTGITVDLSRVFQPAVVTELARFWNRVELPKLLAGAHVKGTHHAFGVVVRKDLRTFLE